MSPAPEPKPFQTSRERRLHSRFPVVASVEFVVKKTRGQAVTSDVSSGGVLLKTSGPLPVGEPIRLWMEWPALFDGQRRMRLFIEGRVLRSTTQSAAVRILRHEYKVRPVASSVLAVAS